ncbi:hypothetical protein NEOC84_001375|nr:hypothetical protein [Neochlamydia sp. AcF95]NGY95458.1 hypothetical protein [Neochlamydia sp. AcF84]
MSNRLGELAQPLTMRWIFSLFEGVFLLIRHKPEDMWELVLNLKLTRQHILQVLGPPFQEVYAKRI